MSRAVVALTVALLACVSAAAEPPALNDAHVHLASLDVVPKLLAAMDRAGVKRAVLAGSPDALFTRRGLSGYEGSHENNLVVLEAQRQHPDRFLAYPVIDPADPAHLERLKDYVGAGARGLKLYSGYGWFYTVKGKKRYVYYRMPLNDPRMEPAYAYCEAAGLPVSFTVSAGSTVNDSALIEQLADVLAKHPAMTVICPHFMLLSRIDNGGLERVAALLDAFPNLHTDTGFTRADLDAAFRRFSAQTDAYRAFVTKYSERILFSTNLVISDRGFENIQWIEGHFRAYAYLLATERFGFFLFPGEGLLGLHLDADTLDAVCFGNFERLLLRPKATLDAPVPEALSGTDPQ